MIVETGKSPRKLGDGVGHYQLVYRRGKNFRDVAAEVRNGEEWSALYPMEDIFFQASTRGGRAIDRIVEGQIQFKENTRAVGSTLSSVSQDSMLAGFSSADGGAVGAGYAAISLISVAAEGMSASANTRADIRYWEGLPDTIHLLPVTPPRAIRSLSASWIKTVSLCQALPTLPNSNLMVAGPAWPLPRPAVRIPEEPNENTD